MILSKSIYFLESFIPFPELRFTFVLIPTYSFSVKSRIKLVDKERDETERLDVAFFTKKARQRPSKLRTLLHHRDYESEQV